MQNPLTNNHRIPSAGICQVTLGELLDNTPIVTELDDIFDCIPYKKLLRAIRAERTRAYSPLGHPGYSPEVMLRAYLASYALGVRSTNDLITQLENNPVLRVVCGFNIKRPLPHRTTFNRFMDKLIKHQNLVDECLNEITTRLYEAIPNFGKTVAIDATTICSHSNPDKKSPSDPEAGFAHKGRGIGKGHWDFGYYLHLVADASLELPIAKEMSFSRQHEMEMAIPLLRKARNDFQWFDPEVVTADAGYDKYQIYEDIVCEFDAEPIIALAKKGPLISGTPAAPVCPGGLPLIHIGFYREGHRYECPARARKSIECPLPEKCPLKVAYIHPDHDYRRFGYHIPRTAPEWQEIYNKRVAVERVYSRLKGKRRLNSHCFRGFNKINLHCTLSLLVMQAMALARVKVGQLDQIRVSSRKIA